MPLTPEDVIQNLGELPLLPQVAARVMRISEASSTSSEELQNLIRTDQALTAKVLRIANSAMFGMRREVVTLTQAMLTLGFLTARSVVVAASVKNLFSRGTVGPHDRTLWEHALVTAIAGSAFSKAMRFPETEEVFLAGLMHDIGKTLLSLKYPEPYGALLDRVIQQEGDGLTLELEAFGFDHAMVGEALFGFWNIAKSTQAAVRWHHDPSQAPPEHRRLVALVALGNQVALDLKVGIEMPDSLTGATWEAKDILRLDDASYQEYRALAVEALKQDTVLITDF